MIGRRKFGALIYLQASTMINGVSQGMFWRFDSSKATCNDGAAALQKLPAAM